MGKTATTWQSVLDDAIDSAAGELVAVRRHLHANPEISQHEFKSTQFLAEKCEALGFSPRIAPSGRGLFIDTGDEDSPRFGIRADIDALPIQDGKQVAYRSTIPGVMHACGHDAHTACAFGALMGIRALDMAQCMPSGASIRAIFQPAEEANTGALEMIEAGAIEGLHGLFGLHVDPTRQAGVVAMRPGPFTADCDEMYIVVRGRGGHASRPHESSDPIAAAAQFINSVYLFVPRSHDSQDPVVVTIGHIVGGHSYNVIPDDVLMKGTLRSFDPSVRERTMEHIKKLANGVTQASGCEIEVEFRPGPPSVRNDSRLTRILRDAANDALGPANVQDIARPSMGGEDFAHYLKHVPGAMFRLGCAPNVEPAPSLHSTKFDIDERALAVGAKVLARAVLMAGR